MPESRNLRRLRQAVLERAKGCCEYCRNPVKYVGTFSLDHSVRRSKGGKTTLDNLAYLAFACVSCNGHKHKRTHVDDPVTGRTVALFNPRKQQWQEHFAWSAECTTIQGLTPVGRATVNALRLNRDDAVNLRRLLFAFGEHPPQD